MEEKGIEKEFTKKARQSSIPEIRSMVFKLESLLVRIRAKAQTRKASAQVIMQIVYPGTI